MARTIENNTARYLQLFSDVIDKLLPRKDISTHSSDVEDIIYLFRDKQQKESMEGKNKVDIPKELMRRYELYFKPREANRVPVPLREGLVIVFSVYFSACETYW